MEDILGAPQDISLLSLQDLLNARELFHRHLMNRRHVVATAVGKYLIRKSDPWPTSGQPIPPPKSGPREERRLDNSEVRPYSPPCILVFVDEWLSEEKFIGDRDDGLSARDLVPKALYLPNGFTVPVCVVSLKKGPEPPPPVSLRFPPNRIGGGYPVKVTVQGRERIGSVACLVTDGHLVYALTNRHVVGEPGTQICSELSGETVKLGVTSTKQLTKQPFKTVYPGLPGQRVLVNMDLGLIQLDDLNRWTAQVYGIGQLGPIADLNAENVSLRLIGAHVRAHGAVSGPLIGEIDALFYRYKSIGGFEYIADFLIGPRSVNGVAVRTERGDSGTLWLLETRPAQDEPADADDDGGASAAAGGRRLVVSDGDAEDSDPSDTVEPADNPRRVLRRADAEDEYQVRPSSESEYNEWVEGEREEEAEREELAPSYERETCAEAWQPAPPPSPFSPPGGVVYRPLAVQWGGEVIDWSGAENRTYILATSLSAACRLLDLDVITDLNGGLPEYWGQRGHYTVASLAVDRLFPGRLRTLMRANLENLSYPRAELRRSTSGHDVDGFVRLADVADLIWKPTPGSPGPFNRKPRENPNHFAPIDKRNPMNGKTLLDLCMEDPANLDVDVWLHHYLDANVPARNRGVLPFRVRQIYQNMVASAANGDATRFVCAAGILAHYVGDACQPLHCSFMSNGIPQPGPDDGAGVHEAYEGDMVDSAFSSDLDPDERLVARLPGRIAQLESPPTVQGGAAAAFAIVELMRETLQTLPPIEIIAQFKANDSAPVMWDVLGDATVTVIARGILYLAMLWRSAWNEGGSAHISNTGLISHAALRQLYETSEENGEVEFLPSRTIAGIKGVI